MDMTIPLILACTSALTWWLSGYDSQVTKENPIKDIKRRALRCGATLLLVTIGIAAATDSGRFGGFVLIALVLPLSIVWAGCVSELLARGFHGLVDFSDLRRVDPKELTRELDRMAQFVQQGRNEEAIHLCARLRKSAEGSALALDTTLFSVYDGLLAGSAFATPLVTEAQQAYDAGHCLLAESRLTQVLKGAPGNLKAGMLLIRLYAQNLHNRNRAQAVLRSFEERNETPPGFVDYARQRLKEWLDPAPERPPGTEGIESVLIERKLPEPPEEVLDPKTASVSELLKAGHLGTAIERLETSVKERPQDFDLRLQLAEAYGRYCCNLSRASEIVAKIEAYPTFRPDQVRVAKAKLREWRARLSN
jgi:hypothetical protein